MKHCLPVFVCFGLFGAALSGWGASDDDATPRPKRKAVTHGTPIAKKKATPDDDESGATPKPTPKLKPFTKADADEKPAHKTSDESETKAAAPESTTPTHYPAATLDSSELQGFAEQPEPVQRLIEAALALTKLNLTYQFGSDDPANGGMDCSGTIAYVLRGQGFKDVPRDASGQYVWARRNDQFFAVVSKKPGGFEFSDLLPGDLLFWSGTYNSGDRDPPVTHSMLYLGREKKRKQPVMFGASDGRSYDGKARWGVSVFDFTMPRTETGTHADFLGYARIPGLRAPAVEKPVAESAAAETPAPAKRPGSTPRKRRAE